MPLPELVPRESRVKGLVTACLRNAKKVIAGCSLEGERAMSGLAESMLKMLANSCPLIFKHPSCSGTQRWNHPLS